MTKFRKIIPRSSRRKKLILFFVVVSLSFISGGYALLNSNVGFLGSLFVNHYENPVIQTFSSTDNTKFRSSTYKSKIETITLSGQINPPSSYDESWNLGVNDSDNVKGYIVKRTDADIYDLYIQGDGGLIANEDSTYLFGGLTGLKTINGLAKLDTGKVKNMSHMFYNCRLLTSLDLSNFDTSKVIDMSYMFSGCRGLTSLDLSNFVTTNVTDMRCMFRICVGLTSIDLSNFDTSNVTDMSYMFCSPYSSASGGGGGSRSISNIPSNLIVSIPMALTEIKFGRNFSTDKVTNMEFMFFCCSGLNTLDLSKFDTSNVTNMNYMFCGCSSLASLDLSSFDTSNVTDMAYMFSQARYTASSGFDVKYSMKLTEIKFGSNFNTNNVTNMNFMFNGCSGLTSIDLSNFNTSNVININSMFRGCSGLTSINLSNLNTSNVTSMNSMFSGCSGLTSIDLSNLNTSNVTSMNSMFSGCSGLTSLDLSNLNTSNVTSMYYMFSGCSGLTSMDLSKFNTSNVTNMNSMFSGCTGLTKIYVGLNWNVDNITYSSDMFKDCTSLSGAVAYDSSKVDVTMANYTTGYLTLTRNFAILLQGLPLSDTVIVDDGTVDHNMRYTGKEPNNYVTFNGEIWRVIGVFNNVSNDSKSDTRVKIIKSTPLESKMKWHTSAVNIWKSSQLNTELQASKYASNSMVEDAVWYLGDVGGGILPITMTNYEKERSTKVASGNDPTWKGKVGLMYPSDYGFASSGCKDGAQNLSNYNNATCKDSSWLFRGSYEWLLSPNSGSIAVRALDSTGYVGNFSAGNSFDFRPVVYLKSNVTCTNCDEDLAGTQSNPFELGWK